MVSQMLSRLAACFTLLAMLTALGACSTWQPPPLAQSMPANSAANVAQQARFAGHLSLKLQAFEGKSAEGGSFHFDLQGNTTAGVLDISTPLGTMVASVRWSPENANLLTPDGQQVYASIDALLTQAVGEALPIATIMQWLKGQPDPSLPSTWADASTSSTAGTRFEQAGWQVDIADLPSGVLHAIRDPQPSVRGARLTIRLDP